GRSGPSFYLLGLFVQNVVPHPAPYWTAKVLPPHPMHSSKSQSMARTGINEGVAPQNAAQKTVLR
ncbi:hypothetical protein, partial [Pseudomonas luteola]|uniref:hypothetical protein n=1 Tax=Pseudomonas luteola TaxID=47886 RepID=UPI00289B685C